MFHANKFTGESVLFSEIRFLRMKHSISKAEKTKGYSRYTLYDTAKDAGHSACGDYDLKGAVFGKWLSNHFQDRLLLLAERQGVDENGGITDFYGAYLRKEGNFVYVSLTGGVCGASEMRKIANGIGINVKVIYEGYFVEIIPTEIYAENGVLLRYYAENDRRYVADAAKSRMVIAASSATAARFAADDYRSKYADYSPPDDLPSNYRAVVKRAIAARIATLEAEACAAEAHAAAVSYANATYLAALHKAVER
jgi:hypothetical protein